MTRQPPGDRSRDIPLPSFSGGTMKREARSKKTGIDRRSLFRYGAASGALSIAGRAMGRASATASSPPPGPAADVEPFELDELTIADLQKRIESGQDSARSLVEKYIARIEALDKRGPRLSAVLELNPEASAIAEQLDAERKAGKIRGPLHGIPVLVKDNIGTADRMTTTAGSLALEGSIPSSDSFVAKKLREAGAI